MKSLQEIMIIIKQLRKELQKIYGSRLEGVYLFGSYARGEANEDSDIDVAVVLKDMTSRFEERLLCSEIQAKISLENNCVITLFFSDTNELSKGEYAIFRSIAKEGVVV